MQTDNQLFTTDTLGELDDGATRLLIDAALAEALADCGDRPTLNKPRKVMIQLDFEPELDKRGAMVGVRTKANITLRIPGQATRPEFLPTSQKGDVIEARLPSDYARPMFIPAPTEEEN